MKAEFEFYLGNDILTGSCFVLEIGIFQFFMNKC